MASKQVAKSVHCGLPQDCFEALALCAKLLPRKIWKKLSISVVGVKKKLRRLSIVGSQIGRRSLESAPAAFFLCLVRRHEVSAIVDQIGINTKHRRDGSFNLRVVVMLATKMPCQIRDQLLTVIQCRVTNNSVTLWTSHERSNRTRNPSATSLPSSLSAAANNHCDPTTSASHPELFPN